MTMPMPDDQPYVWHHHQDGFMELIPEDIHDAVKHAGGFSKKGG